jgi:hypothetical protein
MKPPLALQYITVSLFFVSDFLAVLMGLLQLSAENTQIKGAISYYSCELSCGFGANLYLLSEQNTLSSFTISN